MPFLGVQPSKGLVGTAGIDADAVTGAKIADDTLNSEHYIAASIDNEHLADDAVGIAELSATGTASSSTYLRGDNSWAAAGGGKVLQVVASYDTGGQDSTTSTSFIASGHSGAITPSASSSKILIYADTVVLAGASDNIEVDLYYDIGGAGYNAIGCQKRGGATGGDFLSLSALISPSTTSAVTVKPYFRCVNGSNTSYYNYYGDVSNMILMEIGA
jgi:hypothetical protein